MKNLIFLSSVLLSSFLILIAVAEAKDCYNGGSGRYKICVGDQLIDKNPTNEQDLIGTLREYKKDKAVIIFPSGKIDKRLFVTKLERSHQCFGYDTQQICVGDVVKTKRSEGYPDNSFKVTHILESSGWSEKGNILYFGYDKDGAFINSPSVVISEGDVPHFPNLRFGDIIPRAYGKLLGYNVTDDRYEINSSREYNTLRLTADQLRARLGETELRISQEKEDGFYGHAPKDQRALFERYKEYLESECKEIFLNSNGIENSFPIIEVTDISVEILDTKNSTRVMLGAECFPLPIPWISKSARIQYKASGVCKFKGFKINN